MLTFILRKLAYGFLVLLGVVCAVFFLFMTLPGDPAMLTMGQRTDISSIEAVNKEFGLDKPKSVQFLLYMNDISPLSVHYNSEENKEKYHYTSLIPIGERVLVLKFPYLRKSYQTQKSVGSIIAEALPNTIVLAIAAIIFAIVIGIFLGTVAAVAHQTWLDSTVLFVSVLGISVPSFFSAILLQWVFAFVLSSFTGL
ncbi:MAG: ABC transporter permease, partial [Bacteroidota bacterium]